MLNIAVTTALVMAGAAVAVPGTAHADDAAGAAPVSSPKADPLTTTAALTQARASGQPVEVGSQTTATDTVLAQPDGSLTLTRYAVPVRRRVDGVWKALDATLRTNADGSITPTLATSDLRLSPGGSGPVVTMASGGRSLGLTLPFSLPAPTLDGATATYAEVLPGVDLQVVADTFGGIRQALIVHDVDAAANPALRSLRLTTTAAGLTTKVDGVGNLAVSDTLGRKLFTAPAPTMWDSAGSQTATTLQRSGTDSSVTAGAGDVSTAAGPGEGAHLADVDVAAASGAITLTPDTDLLSNTSTVWPVYIDPSWAVTSVAFPTVKGHASLPADYPSSNYWNNTGDPNSDYLQVGDSGSFRSHSLINFSIPTATLAGATILSATIKIQNVYSYSCTATKTRVYAPSTTLSSSNATWNYWFGSSPVSLGSVIDSPSFAHGYSSSCSSDYVNFDVASAVQADVNASTPKQVQTFVFTGDSNETSDPDSWKKFSISHTSMTVTYNHAPDKPSSSSLSTSPLTSCASTGTVTSVGDGPVILNAKLTDRDNGPLGAHFKIWKTTTPSTPVMESNENTLTTTPGTTLSYTVPEDKLKAQAGTTVTQFSWQVGVWDGIAAIVWSTVCSFQFDPTRPGQPQITNAPADGATHIGSPVEINVTAPASGTAPASYIYQLNAGAPVTIPATNGNATITVVPTRRMNTLTVNSVSPGGNIGLDAAIIPINTASSGLAADSDITGDGVADLLTAGSTNGLPAGIWLGTGKSNGQVVTSLTNLGVNGNGLVGDNSASDFTGAQIITGIFTGNGPQDVLAYYPNTGVSTQRGTAVVIKGTGDDSPLRVTSGYTYTIFASSLADVDSDGMPIDGQLPLQIVNAGDGLVDDPDAHDYYSADLLAINGSTGNYHLIYYANGSAASLQDGQLITLTTPTGDMNWDQWKLATTQIVPAGSTVPQTDMFLWKPSTGALYLWRNFHQDSQTGAFVYDPYQLSASGWNTGTNLTLQAADINNDHTPDLWAVGAGQTITAYTTNLPSGSGGTVTITNAPGQVMSSSTHHWTLADRPSSAEDGDTITTTLADNATTGTSALPLTPSASGVTWHTGDVYNPDAMFNGTSGVLSNTAKAITTNGDFSVSAWVKPTANSGTVVSQAATNTAGFKIYAEPTDSSWRFSMSQTDVASPTWDIRAGRAGSVKLGLWTHLIATYKQSTGAMRFYIDGIEVSSGAHTTSYSANGAFAIGAQRTSASAYNTFFGGQIADVQTWNQVITPTQPATPASYYVPMKQVRVLDTRNGTGGVTGPVTANSPIKFKVAGISGVPATKVTAVALVVTSVSSTDNGYLSVYPDNTPVPYTSNVNYVSGVTTSNSVITPVGDNGYVDIWSKQPTQILADVTGYFTTDTTVSGYTTYNPVTPSRLVDTRTSTKVPAGETLNVQITGQGGVPNSTDVTAVAVNINVINQSNSSWLMAYAAGTDRPAPASDLQFDTNSTAQMNIVPIGTGGKISIYTNSATTDLVIDVVGYFSTGANGMKFHTINAARMLNTNIDGGAVTGGSTVQLSQGNTIIAANPVLVLSAAATAATTNGYLNIWQHGPAQPATSTVAYQASETVPNLNFAQTGSGLVDIAVHQTTGTVQLVIDCFGYFAAN